MALRNIFIIIFLSWNVNPTIAQQERMFLLGSLMGDCECDSTFTKDYIARKEPAIYYNTDDTLLITYCFQDDWCSGFKIHDTLGYLHFYFGATEHDDYSKPFLHRAEWDGNELVMYEILGPFEFYQSYYKDKDGNIRVIDRTESSAGYILEMDSTHRTTAKGVYKEEKATITWYHYHESGRLKEKFTHYWPRRECRVGPYVMYDENGELLISGQYLTYEGLKALGLEDMDLKGVKDGVWKEFENGKVVKEELWEMGKLKK